MKKSEFLPKVWLILKKINGHTIINRIELFFFLLLKRNINDDWFQNSARMVNNWKISQCAIFWSLQLHATKSFWNFRKKKLRQTNHKFWSSKKIYSTVSVLNRLGEKCTWQFQRTRFWFYNHNLHLFIIFYVDLHFILLPWNFFFILSSGFQFFLVFIY